MSDLSMARFFRGVTSWMICCWLMPICFAVESVSVPEEDIKGKIAIVPVKGAIVPDNRVVRWLIGTDEICEDTMVIQAIDRAEAGGATLVVIEMDSPGGEVQACERIAQRLIRCKVPTVALVVKSAISGGSMVSTACNQIIMCNGSTIGDCEPHAIAGDLGDNKREKAESPLRARMRANAEANGFPKKILEAMVTKSLELHRVTFKDGSSEFLYRNELDALQKAISERKDARVIMTSVLVVAGDRLLTLTAQEAVDYGLASETVLSADDYYAAREESTVLLSTVRVAKDSEPISKVLLMVLVLCLVIGIAGVVVEVNVPGFGLPGILGIIGFSSFFVILFFNGRAEWWEMSLFVVGLVLLLLEIFVIPGFGVAGVLGVLCLLSAITFGILPPLGAQVDWWTEVGRASKVFSLGGIGAVGLLWLFFTYLERIPVVNRLILASNLKSGSEVMAEATAHDTHVYPHEQEQQQASALKGECGVALTVLRPSGKIRVDDGRVLDVVSDGGMIEKDVRVVVVDVNGPRISVREA